MARGNRLWGHGGKGPSYTWNRIIGRGAKAREREHFFSARSRRSYTYWQGSLWPCPFPRYQRPCHPARDSFLPLKASFTINSSSLSPHPSFVIALDITLFCTNLLAGFLSVLGHWTWQCRPYTCRNEDMLDGTSPSSQSFCGCLDNTHVKVNSKKLGDYIRAHVMYWRPLQTYLFI